MYAKYGQAGDLQIGGDQQLPDWQMGDCQKKPLSQGPSGCICPCSSWARSGKTSFNSARIDPAQLRRLTPHAAVEVRDQDDVQGRRLTALVRLEGAHQRHLGQSPAFAADKAAAEEVDVAPQ